MALLLPSDIARHVKEVALGEGQTNIAKLYCFCELYLSLFNSDSTSPAFSADEAAHAFETKLINCVKDLQEWSRGPMHECSSFAAFARNSSPVLRDLCWPEASPALKWLLLAVELMNNYMEYESDSSSSRSGRFFELISGSDKLATNSLIQVMWLVSLADAWNNLRESTIGKVDITIYASLDHVWFGYRDDKLGWVPCELCCTASSNDLVLACIGNDPSMLFRNTLLSGTHLDSGSSGDCLDAFFCSKQLSREDFMCYLLMQCVLSMKEDLECILLSINGDGNAEKSSEHNKLSDGILEMIDIVFSFKNLSDHCLDKGHHFLVGCLLLVADCAGKDCNIATKFKDMLCDHFSSIEAPSSEHCSALQSLNRAVQFNSEHYLARMYLVKAFLKVDSYLAYKHTRYLLDLIGVYNENGLSAKCQSVYQYALDSSNSILATSHFNETVENEYVADIPEIGGTIVVTWDVEFEDNPADVQPYEYDATLCVKLSSDDDIAGSVVGDDTLCAPYPRLYVHYVSTGEKYYVRFKSHESCDHLMEDGEWESFPYYLTQLN